MQSLSKFDEIVSALFECRAYASFGKTDEITYFLPALRALCKSDGRSVLEAALVPLPGYDFSFQVKEIIQLAPSTGVPEITLKLYEKNLLFSDEELAVVVVPIDEENMEEKGDPLVFQAMEPWQEETVKVCHKYPNIHTHTHPHSHSHTHLNWHAE